MQFSLRPSRKGPPWIMVSSEDLSKRGRHSAEVYEHKETYQNIRKYPGTLFVVSLDSVRGAEC